MAATFGAPAGRGRARRRAAAVRVLDPGASSRWSWPPRRRRRCTRRSSATARSSRCRPTTTPGSTSLPVVRRCSASPAALLAIVITRGLFLVEAGYRRLPVGELLAPGHRGGRLRPRRPRSCRGPSASATTRSATSSQARLAARHASPRWPRAKLLAWWLALGSGTSGGTLAPILLISAVFGTLVGAAVDHVAPRARRVAPARSPSSRWPPTFGAATRATLHRASCSCSS